MTLPTTPRGWANRLSQIVRIIHETHGIDRFPIDVKSIALEYSKSVFPDEPITAVDGNAFDKFEGALIPCPKGSGEWGIFYNSSITSPGRINFTLGHELGHYLLHRHLSGDPIYCAKRDMWKWDSEYGKMEAEANQFASYLLMPLDDFREQTNGLSTVTVAFFDKLRIRYEVSLTAAILKWLEFTSKRAMIVVSRDGFIDWSWSSKPLIGSGVFFRARQQVTPLPDASLAAGKASALQPEQGVMLNSGIWAKDEDVFESVIFSEYHEMAVSLLVYPDSPPGRAQDLPSEYRDEDPFDTFDQFQRN